MRQPSGSTARYAVVVLSLVAGAVRADAAPIRYEYRQTGAAPSVFVVAEAWIEIDGGFADLPVTSCLALGGFPKEGECRSDLWPLLDLRVEIASGPTYTLEDFFTAVERLDVGTYFISPIGIDFFPDPFNQLHLNFVTGTIRYGTDDDSPCNWQGHCVAFGSWVPVPEPGTLALTGLGLFAATRRRRSKSCRPGAT